MSNESVVLGIRRLGFPWETQDPFLFCVHHLDHYPRGNERMEPVASLDGRSLGQDFATKDGFRMYHGRKVPGFPPHPHRGFETITIARQGFIDHSDSLGAAARFGQGDVQWMTAGRGIVHAEMFPLLNQDKPNPAELFQIWLNLPKSNKLVAPYFSMFWHQNIPTFTMQDEKGRNTVLTIVAGSWPKDLAEPEMGSKPVLPPPPDSWAAVQDANVAIWTISMTSHAEWTLPATATGTNRSLYVATGKGLDVAGVKVSANTRVDLRPEKSARIVAGEDGCELLLLQGKPIGEPVVQHGPFVMNSTDEIRQAFVDYQRDGFGGWPWPSEEPVHALDAGRFAKFPDGRVEKPA